MLTMVYGLWFMVDIYRTGGSEKKNKQNWEYSDIPLIPWDS